MFISFEGTEGSGKSTQMRLLVEWLRHNGRSVTVNQEPGGTAIGKEIRRIVLDPENAELAPMAELLLMFASRAQAAAETIAPALQRGDIVVSDRFTDSSVAYQGAGRELGVGMVLDLHLLALGSMMPDITLCLTVDVEVGLARASKRNRSAAGTIDEARIDEQSLAFHKRVASAYRCIAKQEPQRFLLVDASGSIEEVAAGIQRLLQPKLR